MKLNPMQLAAGKAIQQNQNVLLLSPTGSGKTLAYLLPLISRIDTSMDTLQAVVVVPSREGKTTSTSWECASLSWMNTTNV